MHNQVIAPRRIRHTGRTPLFGALQRALRIAVQTSRTNGPSVDELIEARHAAANVSRRDFLKTASVAALAAGTGALWTSCATADKFSGPNAPRVVIVGAGMAGLNAGYRLRRAGLRAEIFEGSSRVGGRMFSGHDILAPGLTTELGGEFIDTNHKEMRRLISEFNLPTIDVKARSERDLIAEAYFFDGGLRSEKELIEAFLPVAPKIQADYDSTEEIVDFEHEGGAKELDNLSLAQYLDRIGATGWLRELLEVAFVTEYGMDADEQSSLNMLFMISTETKDGVALLGESDERFKVLGGNDRITTELATRLAGQIQTGQRLVRVKSKGEGFVLSFDVATSSPREVEADFVILTVPFTLLREVELQVELPEVKRKAIAELGYGNCAKVMAGFNTRVWRENGYAGNVYSDEPFQLAWDNSRQQPSPHGGITFYSGGKAALETNAGSPEEQVKRLLPGLDQAFGQTLAGALKKHFGVQFAADVKFITLKEAYNGKTARFHWPTYPWTKSAYASYKAGQWTTIAGAEGRPVGNLYFAGEHCSYDFQGFMNGAAETGRQAALDILAALKKQRVPYARTA
ncbi:MAG: FAD-dependent oxidoreductase [Verrucomicrobiota bacterium]